MAERERPSTPPDGGVFAAGTFVAHSHPMDADDVRRALWRIAHEVVERNHGLADVVVVGLQTGGVPLAQRLTANLAEIEGTEVPEGTLDVAFYRDDIGLRPVMPEAPTAIPVDLTDRVVVLVPPELSADIIDKGIILAGGGSLLKNLDKRLREETGLPVAHCEEPGSAVVRGTGMMLTNIDLLRKIAIA